MLSIIMAKFRRGVEVISTTVNFHSYFFFHYLSALTGSNRCFQNQQNVIHLSYMFRDMKVRNDALDADELVMT